MDKVCFHDYVKMTQEDYDKLVLLYGQSITDEYIEKLDMYIGMKGCYKKYKDHYRVIRTWLRKEGVKTKEDSYRDILLSMLKETGSLFVFKDVYIKYKLKGIQGVYYYDYLKDKDWERLST